MSWQTVRQRSYVMLTLEVDFACECYRKLTVMLHEQNRVMWCVMAYEMKPYYFAVMKHYFIKIYQAFFFFFVWKMLKTDLYYACIYDFTNYTLKFCADFVARVQNTVTSALMSFLLWNVAEILQVSEKSGTNRNFIYYLHYMLYMFTPTLYTHFLSRFTMFVWILLNILGSTVAQQCWH
jgi:hypothetical protein